MPTISFRSSPFFYFYSDYQFFRKRQQGSQQTTTQNFSELIPTSIIPRVSFAVPGKLRTLERIPRDGCHLIGKQFSEFIYRFKLHNRPKSSKRKRRSFRSTWTSSELWENSRKRRWKAGVGNMDAVRHIPDVDLHTELRLIGGIIRELLLKGVEALNAEYRKNGDIEGSLSWGNLHWFPRAVLKRLLMFEKLSECLLILGVYRYGNEITSKAFTHSRTRES